MSTTIFVDIFFVISLLVFMTTLCIILPTTLLKRKALLKAKGEYRLTNMVKSRR